MTKDYKARPVTPRVRRGRQGSCFFWFVTGAVLGGFGVGVAWILRQPGPPPAATTAAKTQSQPVTKPRFDFYNILPEMEVVVPDEELSGKAPPVPKPTPPQPPTQPVPERTRAQAPEPAQQQTAKPAPAATDDGGSYLLQVASFRAEADAERVKAQLALLGIHAQIQRVTINNKDTYHRVRAGPFRDKQALNKVRSLLSSNGFQSVPIKLK
ncbi:MAG: SPOR domain-containing protein [Chromatiaceae bacterium]